jgi:hypothetical protein
MLTLLRNTVSNVRINVDRMPSSGSCAADQIYDELSLVRCCVTLKGMMPPRHNR